MFRFENCNYFRRLTIFSILAFLAIITVIPLAFLYPPPVYGATDFVFRTTKLVYSPGDVLTVYGAAAPNEVLVVRIYDPSGLAVRIDNVLVDAKGFFRQGILEWPEPDRNLAFGTYTVEASSSIGGKGPKQVEVSFAEGLVFETPTIQVPKSHVLSVKLDAPSQVTVNNEFRIFVQVTYDGALVDAKDEAAVSAILGSSHIHSNNSTIVLNDKFVKLHPGLYYADVKLDKEGAYIMHAVAFYKGFISHDSRVVAASGSSIGTIQESVDKLNQEITHLQSTVEQTRSSINDTQTSITTSVEEARASIREDIGSVRDASGQINSLILPVLALISVIIALQISLFARIRASYR